MPLTPVARLATAATIVWWSTIAAGSPQDDLLRALDRYNAGDHDAAIAGIDRTTTAGALRTAAENWIEAGDASARARRQRVAAGFALEAVWARKGDNPTARFHSENHDFWPVWRPSNSQPWEMPFSDTRAVVPIVSWGCHLIDTASVSHPADTRWDLASVAVLQEVDASGALIDWRPAGESPRLADPLLLRERSTGHLAHARARMPHEARWSMAEAVAWANRDSVRVFEYRRAVLRYRPGNPSVLPRIAVRFEALTHEPVLAAEARLRIAHVELQRQRWTDALGQIERARPDLTERFLIAVADYFSGWALEQMGRRDDAIAAYRRALSASPHARNPSTLLAAQLFLANERAEAYAVLEAALEFDPQPVDLVVRFERGDGRYAAEHVSRLRESLR
jgi:tetratricopeptide (TPR) repeat protein